MSKELVFSNARGQYIDPTDISKHDLLREINIMGTGNFPYRELERRYEACESFNVFKDRQEIVKPVEFKYADLLRYSFGLEFETSMGYVPEKLIFRDGLIPLRDGSIGGLEYSTVVLKGNEGLNLLKQQVDTLKKYTAFNKECSLHIHLGGFPLRQRKAFNLYRLCEYLQNTNQIQQMVPNYTLKSSKYKKSGKDYCNPLPSYRTFDDLYYGLVGTSFEGSFRRPHPQDPDRSKKWQIHTRYYWVNFINFFCYNVNKTIEFRLLRPTYNFNKICDWLYIFNALLLYADAMESEGSMLDGLTFGKIFDKVYPKELAEILKTECTKLRIERDNQTKNEDYNGSCLQFENLLFNESELL